MEHTGQIISPVLALHTEEELERGARLLLLRASRRVRPDDVWRYFAAWDLPEQHVLEIPEHIVHGGLDLERGDTFLVLADPNLLGLVVRQGGLSSVLIFNPPGVVRCDPNADDYPRPPPRPRILSCQSRALRLAMARSERRAKALLFRYLAREQKWELRAYRRFTVVGQDGLTYRIYAWSGMNVRLVEGDKEVCSLCVVAKLENPVPTLDLMLAQKVLLENDISQFLKIAIRRPIE
jgi:hypothetical protein